MVCISEAKHLLHFCWTCSPSPPFLEPGRYSDVQHKLNQPYTFSAHCECTKKATPSSSDGVHMKPRLYGTSPTRPQAAVHSAQTSHRKARNMFGMSLVWITSPNKTLQEGTARPAQTRCQVCKQSGQVRQSFSTPSP